MLSFKVFLVFAACLAWSHCKQNKYCSLCTDHTMCKYTGFGPQCKSGSSGVTESEKKEIVDLHNKLRRKVATGQERRGASGGQPKAADLRKFVWDDELADVAQRWANQCHFGHDSCRKDPRWLVGQNIFWGSQSPEFPVNWTNTIYSWYDEVQKYNPADIQKYRFKPESGHYTQLLWHSTYAVGCGRKNYGQEQICVCNYGPAGNMIGDRLYTVGEPCSSCPQGTTCDDSLCAATTLSSRTQTLSEAYWRNNPEEGKSSKSPKESVPSISAENSKEKEKNYTLPHPFHIPELANLLSTSWESDKDITLDEETKSEIKKLHVQIDRVLKTFLKNASKNMKKAQGGTKLSDCPQTKLHNINPMANTFYFGFD